MKILTNKYFILGNLLLLLLAIPVTLFFIRQQQELRSRAAPSSKLYFAPESPNTSTQCSSFDVDIMLDPGQNIVSIVDLYLKYDPTRLDILQIKESTSFPTVVRAASITSGAANMSVSIGADVTRAVQSASKVATITLRPKIAGPVQIQIDSEKSRVFSLSPSDQPTENVLSSASPANVNIGTDTCPTGGPPLPTISIVPTATPTPILAPTQAVNIPPVCTELSVSPQATGAAPLAVLLTAKGNDSDGLVAKTTFNFGDGSVQDITEGMNLKNVSVQTNKTYQNAGTYTATVTFTDNENAISQSCTQTIVATATGSGTITPTASPTATLAPTQPPATAVPTIPPTGGIAQTLGIIGAVILVIIGGFVLLAL